MDKRGGEFQDFLSKIFCLTVPKISVGGGDPLVSLISGIEKVWIRGGSITIFRRSFCLTVPKYFIAEHFGVSEKFFYRKFSCIGGGRGITVLSKFFVSQDRNEKLCKGTLLFSGNFLVSKKNLEKRGHITIFSRIFHVSQCRKLS